MKCLLKGLGKKEAAEASGFRHHHASVDYKDCDNKVDSF